MLAHEMERGANPRDAEGDPQISDMLPGAFDDNTVTAPSELIQEELAEEIDFRLAGIGMSACECALNEFSWPAVLHPIWPTIYRLGICDDRASGRFLDALQVADVIFLEGERFDFAAEVGALRGTVAAIAFPVLDEFGEIIDVGAFCPESGMFGLLRGAACLLGAENIHAPRIEHDGVRVHPDALAWLRAGRTGVYVVDPQRARWRLAEERLIVDNLAFGRRLRDALRLPVPSVFVLAHEARRAA